MALDQRSRSRAASVVRSFALGEITNWVFDAQYPMSADRAINEIYIRLSKYVDDFREATFDGTQDEFDELIRCADFLATEIEYAWPSGTLTGRLMERIRGSRVQRGDASSWPFQSKSERDLAQVTLAVPSSS